MDTFLAPVLSLFAVAFGSMIFFFVLKNFEDILFLYYISAFAFVLLAAVAGTLMVLFLAGSVFAMPAVLFAAAMMFLAAFILNLASEEKIKRKREKRKQPISSIDVEKGLDWNKLEKWLEKKGG
jgi:signal transduction histidine kinase